MCPILGPSMVGRVPHIRVASPQSLEGWSACLAVLALSALTVCEGNNGGSVGTDAGDPVTCLPETFPTG